MKTHLEETGNFIHELETRGIHLQVAGDRLRIEAPTGKVTPDEVQFLKDNKTDILEYLRRDSTAPTRTEPAAAIPDASIPGAVTPIPSGNQPERLHPDFRAARDERLNSPDPAIREIWQKVSGWLVNNQAAFGVQVGLLVKGGMPEAQATDQVYTLMEPIMARKVISLKGR